MATRKIRLTLSGTQVNSEGPIIDIDFNEENIEADLEVTAITGTSTMVKEYTVDVPAGSYAFNITYKNDEGDDGDRNLTVEKLEYANDGSTYVEFVHSDSNSSLGRPLAAGGWGHPNPGGDRVSNPDFDSSQPSTDNTDNGWNASMDPGSNPRYSYIVIPKEYVKLFTNGSFGYTISFS